MADDRPWNKYGGTPGEVYEGLMVPQLFAPWAEIHLGRVALRPGQRVLDVACGTGVVARRAAELVGPGGKVVGLDLNAGMLAVARANNPAGAVEWRDGDGLALPFADASFDVVSCQHGLMFFPDRLRGLREMRRVLAPGGQVVVSTWGHLADSPGYAALSAALARHVSEEAGHLPPFALGDRAELTSLLAAAGFEGVEATTDQITLRFPSAEEFVGNIAAGAPTMLGALDQVAGATRRAVLDDVTAALRPYTTADGVAFPIKGHVATGRA
jgi:ubiquinone/menaquinone biosynthesis C-methylase UbiE